MKINKIFIMMTAIAIIALTVTPVLAGGTYEYESTLEYGRKRLPAGIVGVDHVAGGIEVIYNTINTPWLLVETHVEVGETIDDIPQVKGNPIPGLFTYSETHDPMVQYFRYEIMVEGEQFFIAAHAVLYNECTGKYVTAWAEGPNEVEFTGKNWAVGFTFPLPPD